MVCFYIKVVMFEYKRFGEYMGVDDYDVLFVLCVEYLMMCDCFVEEII